MVKCAVCGLESDDLRKHIKEHGLTKAFYLAKFPGSRLIDQAKHEELKEFWRRQKQNLAEARKKKKEALEARKAEQKDTSNDVITGKYKEYYSKIKQKYIEEYKFTDGPEVEELLFFLVSNRQLQDEYDEMVNHGGGMAVVGRVLDDIRKNNAHIQELLVTLLKFKQSMENAEDIVNLHNETLKNAAEYVKKNMGSFVFRCNSCGQVVDMYGFPHPFFEGKEKYHVFSKEMWELVVRKLIPIEFAAFVLHTSPEGLINMARLREEFVPEIDLDLAERKLVELRTLNEA